jgi:hypothetical protein
MNSQLVLRRPILTPQVLPGMDLVAPFSFVAALRPQTSLSLLVRVDSYLRLVRLVAAAVTVQRLVPGPRADGEADRVVELRVGCRGYFLGAGPVPVAGREELGADGLVEGVVYYGGGADGGFADHALDAAGLGEDVFGHVIFDPAAAGELEGVDDVPWVGIGFEGLDGGESFDFDGDEAGLLYGAVAVGVVVVVDMLLT